MKIAIDRDFPVTVLSNSVNISPERRVLITARTRAGKTTLLCHLAAKVMLEDEDNICFIIGPNLNAFCEDVVEKFESIPQLSKYSELLDIRSISEKRTAEMVANQFSYVYQPKPFITVINADHTYVKKILALIRSASIHQPNRCIVVFLDEAHKAGEKTYQSIKSTLNELQNRNICLVETTATYMNRLLSLPPADVQILISKNSDYVDPTEATLIPISRAENNACVSSDDYHLHDRHLDQISLEWENSQSLVLISGQQTTGFHEIAANQCLNLARSLDKKVAVITINKGEAKYVGSDQDTGRIITKPGSSASLRAASSIIAAVHHDGYNHIVVIGHKQVEMGQTIGCVNMPMTLQILMVAKKAPKADNIAQWIRTGGNGVGQQAIMCPAEIWSDYIQHVKSTEELSQAFSGLPGVLQQELAEKLYIKELQHLRQDFGDYSLKPSLEYTDVPTITWMACFPVGSYPDHFREAFEVSQHKRETAEVRAWIATQLHRDSRWTDETPTRIRTCSGDINTRKGRGGNDIQVYVHADPEALSGQAWQRNITAWIRHTDQMLCVRVRPSLDPQAGAVHDYYGNLKYPKSSYKTMLQIS